MLTKEDVDEITLNGRVSLSSIESWIDVSAANGDIDWCTAFCSGIINGVSIKTVEGISKIPDSKFVKNITTIQNLNCGVGVEFYDFFHPEYDEIKQAENFISLIEKYKNSIYSIALDCEYASAEAICKKELCEPYAIKVKNYITRVKDLASGWIYNKYIYTGKFFWTDETKNSMSSELSDFFLSETDLWLAAYTQPKQLKNLIPKPYNNWAKWQCSGSISAPGIQVLHVPGIIGPVDHSLKRF